MLINQKKNVTTEKYLFPRFPEVLAVSLSLFKVIPGAGCHILDVYKVNHDKLLAELSQKPLQILSLLTSFPHVSTDLAIFHRIPPYFTSPVTAG